MLGRASGGLPPDDRAGNVTIENAETYQPVRSISWAGSCWARGDKMLHVGQVLYDNDPRYRGRTVEVSRVEERRLVCKCGSREVVIQRDRVHNDGEQHRSGYSIVPPTAIAGRGKANPDDSP